MNIKKTLCRVFFSCHHVAVVLRYKKKHKEAQRTTKNNLHFFYFSFSACSFIPLAANCCTVQ